MVFAVFTIWDEYIRLLSNGTFNVLVLIFADFLSLFTILILSAFFRELTYNFGLKVSCRLGSVLELDRFGVVKNILDFFRSVDFSYVKILREVWLVNCMDFCEFKLLTWFFDELFVLYCI